MSISSEIHKIKSEIPDKVTLIAVSKTYEEPCLEDAYEAGQRIFGESKPQEMLRKYNALEKDILWHMIGHLQTNKVKYIAPFVSLIHSVDSVKLLTEINKQAFKNNRVIDVLLEVYVAQEDTKSGFTEGEIIKFLDSKQLEQLQNINIKGLMCIGSLTDSKEQTEREFRQVKTFFDKIKQDYLPKFDTLSMGMSEDYMLAIECGSTMIRVGSRIFGARNYK
ncbi:MAG: YggS family pyridoxal phosphate-dependent enzyme [Rikenellaceae bacterium]